MKVNSVESFVLRVSCLLSAIDIAEFESFLLRRRSRIPKLESDRRCDRYPENKC
ncbi:MAG: hypothetical protein AB4290_18455 [Spirulina sp.]